MSSLYELTDDFQKVLEMMYSEEFDPETLTNTLECIECEFEEKAEGYAKVMKNMDGDISAISAEIQRLTDKKKTLENRKNLMKNNLEQAMLLTGKRKFKTALFSFTIQKNGGKQPLDIHGDVPKEFVKIIEEPDKDKIREALESGEVLEFAILQERGESLRIR
jgi:hypothetical protein